MLKTKNIKVAALAANIIAVAVLCAILIGSTFAWFTDSVGSTGNKIQAGTLKVDLQILEGDTWHSLKNENKPIFDYANWEPGYTDVKVLKVVNEGSLALKWKAKIVANGTLSELADVIDVYVLPSSEEIGYPTDRSLDGYTYAGTVADFVDGIETTTVGTLLSDSESYLGVALKMRSDAGNEYQGLDLLGSFDIVIVATQLSSEEDSLGNDYDSETNLDFFPVDNANQLKIALANKETDIILTKNILIDSTYEINYDVNLNGNGYGLYRQMPTQSRAVTVPYLDKMFAVSNGATLELTNIVIDGGAVWSGEIDNILGRGTENAGLTAMGSLLVATGANTKLIVGEDAIIQNNDGVIAVNISGGASLELDGGEIINNNAEGGAIWGGGNITVYSGKINQNSSPSISGAVRMTSGNKFTMYGGEVSHNKAGTVGGAIYTYTNNVLTLAGGEMCGNYSTLGGAIYMQAKGSIYIEGDFRLVGNIADDAGGIRFYQGSTFVMTGGYIAENISINKPSWNGFYCWGVAPTITGGEIVDAITIDASGTPTIGGDASFGALYFSGTTSCKLAEGFDNIRFNVAASSTFVEFKLIPPAGYTYVEGDEDKLVCFNEGYETYYDVDAGVFRIRQIQQ